MASSRSNPAAASAWPRTQPRPTNSSSRCTSHRCPGADPPQFTTTGDAHVHIRNPHPRRRRRPGGCRRVVPRLPSVAALARRRHGRRGNRFDELDRLGDCSFLRDARVHLDAARAAVPARGARSHQGRAARPDSSGAGLDRLGATIFAAGLLLLAAAAIMAAIAVWRSHVLPRTSAILFATGMALFLPQFFSPAPVRIAHGILLAAGSIILAAALW